MVEYMHIIPHGGSNQACNCSAIVVISNLYNTYVIFHQLQWRHENMFEITVPLWWGNDRPVVLLKNSQSCSDLILSFGSMFIYLLIRCQEMLKMGSHCHLQAYGWPWVSDTLMTVVDIMATVWHQNIGYTLFGFVWGIRLYLRMRWSSLLRFARSLVLHVNLLGFISYVIKSYIYRNILR